MAILTRDAILNAPDIQTETVSVPEWGGEVIVRGLTALERDRFDIAIINQDGKQIKMNLLNARAKLVALTVVDETGKQIFKDEDVAALSQKSAAAVDRIYSVAQRLSGISDKDVEELEKNLETTQSEGSPSD